MKNNLRIDFDLPTNHLKGQRFYVPPKARTSTEIERRHDLPNGSLILEQQHLGAKIGEILLGSVEEPEDISFVSRLLAAAGMNTSWYSFGQTDDVMRRRLKLPILAFGFNEEPLTQEDLLLRGSYHLNEVRQIAGKMMTVHFLPESRQRKLRSKMGKAAGNAALSVNCITVGEKLPGASVYMVQDMARRACLSSLQTAKAFSKEFNYPPSLAQLPDPDSDLAVHIRRNAPNNVYEAYDAAIAEHAITR